MSRIDLSIARHLVIRTLQFVLRILVGNTSAVWINYVRVHSRNTRLQEELWFNGAFVFIRLRPLDLSFVADLAAEVTS